VRYTVPLVTCTNGRRFTEMGTNDLDLGCMYNTVCACSLPLSQREVGGKLLARVCFNFSVLLGSSNKRNVQILLHLSVCTSVCSTCTFVWCHILCSFK